MVAKTWQWAVVGGAALLVMGTGAAFTALQPSAGPVAPYEASGTPAQVAHGEYLFHHVMVCAGCHSERDLDVSGHPIRRLGAGSAPDAFDHAMGLPGVIYAPNITPTGIGHWTDAEVRHALITGVTPEGRALFPIMPWPGLAQAAERDLDAVISYLRTLPPREGEVPPRRLDFPVSLIVNLLPEPAEPPPAPPDGTDPVARGRYLVTVASCAACHTPQEGGQPLDGMAFAGGMAFERPGYGTVRSANLTPHQETGLGAWTEEDFVARFAAGAGDHGAPIPPGTMNTVMPWDEYAGMREDDVRAMWAWLQTLPPVDHEVVRFTPSAAERG